MDSLITFLAKYLIILPFLVAVYVLWSLPKDRRKAYLINMVIIGILAVGMGYTLSHLITVPRPPFKDGSIPLVHPSDYNGFPSDHTLTAAFIALGILPFRRRLGWALLAVALLIGWSRVAAHVHHAVDILGSLAIAAIAYWLTPYFVKLVTPAKKSSKPHADA
jgi:undecaprenyl-diphosphatase